MRLRIEMNETHEVEKVGVLDRLVASPSLAGEDGW
jgi:hypothetical protein